MGVFGRTDLVDDGTGVGRVVGTGTADTVAVGTAVGAIGVGVPMALVGTGLGIAVGAAWPVAVGLAVGVLGVGLAVAAALAPLSAVTALAAEDDAELPP